MLNIKQVVLIFFTWLSLFIFSATVFAHGVIESPASREQFCGVESKPDEIFKDKMTHEKCRPIMTKEDGTLDNSVYNFMAVLTHTIGRSTKPIDQLPKNVCGFDSEMWGGGKTPWDKANDWPTTLIKSGEQKFIWNISWGNHFGDTEEFSYWITKPDFQFDPKKELTWNDFETTPFCHLKYNDQSPNANPNVVPDKTNNRFITTCTVPERKNRSVIYAEWGRNSYTYERFHSCIDVLFSTDTNPPDVKAVISPLPAEITGPFELQLDATSSVGNNLSYHWSIDAENLTPYQLQNAQSAKAHLLIDNINAQQKVMINLMVQQGQTSNRVSTHFIHLPAANNATWKTIGRATLDSALKSGDKIQLRLIDHNGKDYFLPNPPMVLSDETADANTWAYILAQIINPANQFSAKIGVLAADNKTIQPIRSAIENMIYVPINSTIINGYVQVEKTDYNQNCIVQRKQGSGIYWLGYDIYASSSPILLNFSGTGIDLSKVIIDKGVFSKIQILDKDKLLISMKPEWVSKTTPGYLGFFGPNHAAYNPFDSPITAACLNGSVFKK